MATYNINALAGGDWTIQKDAGPVLTGSSTAQAAAAVSNGKVQIATFYPYTEIFIDTAVDVVEINSVNVTATGAAAIVAKLNEEVFVGSGGGAITTDAVPTASSTNPVQSGGVFKEMPTAKGFYNLRRGLRRWRQALGMTGKTSAGAGLGGVDVVCFGDSVLEGYNGTDVTFDSAVHKMKVKLQERFNPSGVVGGYGFAPIVHGFGSNSLWTSFGTVAYGEYSWSINGKPRKAAAGANGYYCRMNGGNAAWMRTAADAVQLVGYRFGGYGNARWDIGVGAAPTIGSGSQTGTHAQAIASGFHSGARFGAGTASSFTDKINLTASADNYIQWAGAASGGDVAYEGILAYNGDFDCGVRVHNLAHYGTRVGPQLDYIRDNFSGTTVVTWGRGLLTGGSCNAKLYIFNWILNDCGTVATPTTALSTFTTQYGQAIDYVLGLASKPSVLLVIPVRPSDTALNARTTVGERWQDYVDAIYALADARDNVAVLDIHEYFERTAISSTTGQVFDAGWYGGDTTHLSDTGQTGMADLIYKALSY